MTTNLIVLDYALFIIVVAVSFFTGVLVTCHRKSNEFEYVLGSKLLGPAPIALSVFVSYWSAIAILGLSAESYAYGTQFCIQCFGFGIATLIFVPTFARKFRELNVLSIFQYLEMRFNKYVKLVASIFFIVQNILYLSALIYAPAIAIDEVLGINLPVALLAITTTCIIYSAVGGIRGIVWSDVFQFVVLSVGISIIFAFGLKNVGGVKEVIERNKVGNRFEIFVFNFDPRTRHNVFSLLLGSFGMAVVNCCFNQIYMQRYLAIKSDKHIKRVLIINLCGYMFCSTVVFFTGLIIYAYYHNCDPKLNGTISKYNQIFPLFVKESLSNIPGLAGVFLATICSGAMSSVSSILNSLASLVVYDLIKPFTNTAFDRWVLVLRAITVLIGCLALLLVVVIEKFPMILQITYSILGLFGGPIAGLFILGFIFPFVRWKAALSGFTCSIVFQTWLLVGTLVYASQLQTPTKPMNTNGCSNPNAIKFTNLSGPTELTGVLGFYAISYMWHSLSGIISCMVVALITSVVIGDYKKSDNVDEKLIIRILKQKRLNEINTDLTVNEDS
ncbi:hypothetical protein GJ496_000227 [Pomphorhynchus laevis]|nr:hypothetical protein GJ496_000227 [Pomphorhynchus laevis]